jgi:hypothetical protein
MVVGILIKISVSNDGTNGTLNGLCLARHKLIVIAQYNANLAALQSTNAMCGLWIGFSCEKEAFMTV